MAEGQIVERKLAAIFAADVAEYSRLMGLDEVGTLRTLQAYRAILDRMIATHHGRIFNTAGDSVMADFASPVCAATGRKSPRQDRSNKPRREANGGAQCGKSARCVRRGGGWKRGAVETLRPKPARQSSTLPVRGSGCNSPGLLGTRGGRERAGRRSGIG